MTISLLMRTCIPFAAIALASCGDSQDDGPRKGELASGKILERSISDDMLPYDTVRSQPPRAEPSEAQSGQGAADENGGAAANETASAPAAPPSAGAGNPGGDPVTPGAE